MSSHPVRRLHHDLHRLHVAQNKRQHDARELRKDERALKTDRKHLDHHKDAFESNHKALQKDRTSLANLRDHKQEKLSAIADKLAEAQAAYDASIDPETGLGDPELQAKVDALVQHQTDTQTAFGQKIDAQQQEVEKVAGAVERNRDAIKTDRREIKQDRRELQHDKKALAHDKERVKHARHTALKHLRPAEYEMGLKQTNRVRKELGLKAVDHVIRPMNLNTVRGCAQFLLKSKNVSFWTGLSSGSDRKNLERLARGEKAYVPATGGYVTPKLSMMKALVEMAKHGPIQINALTGGVHSTGSHHYSGTAVDLQVGVGNTSEIVSIANKHGGYRNYETDHIHLDF